MIGVCSKNRQSEECLKNRQSKGRGSSLATSEAGNSSRPFGLFRNLAKGVK